MKKVLKGLFAFVGEIIFLPISVSIWVFALLYAAWCNRLDKEELVNDLRLTKDALREAWEFKISWINL